MGKINKIIIITSIFLYTNIVFSQDASEINEIFKKIELLIEHDRRIIDKKVHITIYNRPKPKSSEIFVRTLDADDDFKHWVSITPDYTIKISKSECKNIEEQILSMDFNTFVKLNNRIGMHGYKCQLTYGDMMSSISLNAWKPTSKTEERQLQAYLKVCNMILEKAEMGVLE
ncbi:hypothetical protein AAFN75_02175 [Algibacter sp. AS12]|uniref:hypothetical protein n=1 Tax=Algibacter sp. AS12 TaxID=3135773 RepID=UPI00398A5B4B